MCKESETKSSTNQKSVAPVPDYIREAGKNLLSRAETMADRPFEPYTGERVAPVTESQRTAFEEIRDLVGSAPNLLNESLDGARGYANAPAQEIHTERVVDEGGRLGSVDDYLNPYVSAALEPALRKIQEQADAQRKRIGGMATSSGAFGDARHGILEGTLGRDTSTAMGDVASNFYLDAFERAMGRRSDDLSRFGTADMANANFAETALGRKLAGSGALLDRQAQDQATTLQRLQALLASGAMEQGQDQAGLDTLYEDFLRRYGHDFSVLEALGAALSGVPYDREQITEGTTIGTEPDNSGLGLAGSIAGTLISAI